MDKPINTQASVNQLPVPAEPEQSHSQELLQVITSSIEEAGGEISFAEYMQLALYQPGLGYYAAGAQKFGEHGDFITAPEVSPLFARSIARQLQQVFLQLEQPVVMEFGAGSGVFCVDLLRELELLGCLPQQYLIIELSAELQQRQQALVQQQIPALADRVQWLSELPQTINGVIVANEVLDAMPVSCFQISGNTVNERTVNIQHGRLAWSSRPAGNALVHAVQQLQIETGELFPDGYCSEINLSVRPWLNSLSKILQQGMVLLIDYGYPRREYYMAERSKGTLICFYKHRAHDDVFYFPGIQDITAFVDFTSVAEAALDTGLDVMGYTTQLQFLFGCGLPAIVETEMHKVADDVRQQLLISQQVKTLTLPSEMGERFKVMALGKNIEPGLIGFAIQDMRNRL